MTSAQAYKEKGNAAFKSSDYPTAIGHYTAAILADPKEPTYPLNRAAAYLKLGKNEDAERDCTKALDLQPKNAKALFRRAQARRGTGKFQEAIADLRAALKVEPSNQSLKVELEIVKGLIDAQAKAKKLQSAKKPIEVKPDPYPPHPKRRKVPITIVDPDSLPTSSEPKADAVKPTQTVVTPPPSEPDIKPVSSRQLNNNATSSPAPSTPPTTSTSPPPTAPEPQTYERPRSKVGGGIFRANGTSTIFHQPSPSLNGGAAPKTLFALQRAWEVCGETEDADAKRWEVLKTISPSRLPDLVGTSLEPSLLASLLHVLLIRARSADAEELELIKSYLKELSKATRLLTVLLFLGQHEKAEGRELLGLVGIELDRVWKGLK